MSTVTKVTKNSLFLFATIIIERLISLFITVIFVRYLGSGDFGKYSIVYAYLSFFQVFMSMGMDYIIIRELSRDSQKGAEFVGSAVTLRFLFSLIGVLLSWVILQWIRYPEDVKLLIYLASIVMFFSAGTLFYNIFQAKLLMAQFGVISMVIKIFLALFTIVLILLKAKLFYFILIASLITIIQIIFIYYYSGRFLQVKIAMDFRVWRELLRNSWPLVISTVFISILTRIDQVMLFFMKGKEDLGLYAAAVKLIELPNLILGVFMTSVFPLLSQYAKTSPDSFKKIYEITFKYPMVFIMPIAVMTTIYSKQIVIACYGQSFFLSWPAMAILIWSTVLVYLTTTHALILIAADLQNLDIIFTASYAILNIILNLILIPKYSFIGASIANIISLTAVIPLSYSLGKTRRFAKVMVKSTIKPLFAALPVGYLVYFLSPLHFIFNIIISVSIYLFLILLIKGLDSEDIRYGREIFEQIFRKTPFAVLNSQR